MYGRPQRTAAEYGSAAVCRRGHVEAAALELRDEIARRCQNCGAEVLTACPSCNEQIRGRKRGALGQFTPPAFCIQCGKPYPWASREAIALHIQNALEEQPDLAEGDWRALLAELSALKEEPSSDHIEERQIGALQRPKGVAPKAWQAALPFIVPIATAEIRRQLGLPTT